MRLLIASLILSSAAIGQATAPAIAQGTCNATNSGTNGAVTVTCYNVDQKLADQIRQLVVASKQDGKTLKNISDKIDALLREIRNEAPTISITSFNQQGGITAGQVTINQGLVQPSPRHIPQESQPQCSAMLEHHPGTVSIMAAQQNNEAFQYAKDWYAVFKAAHWEVVEDRIATFFTVGEPQLGILLKLHGTPVAPGAFVEVPKESPEGMLLECMTLLQMSPKDVHAQRFLDMPEGKIFLEIDEQVK